MDQSGNIALDARRRLNPVTPSELGKWAMGRLFQPRL
jgi:hypothetical protein